MKAYTPHQQDLGLKLAQALEGLPYNLSYPDPRFTPNFTTVIVGVFFESPSPSHAQYPSRDERAARTAIWESERTHFAHKLLPRFEEVLTDAGITFKRGGTWLEVTVANPAEKWFAMVDNAGDSHNFLLCDDCSRSECPDEIHEMKRPDPAGHCQRCKKGVS